MENIKFIKNIFTYKIFNKILSYENKTILIAFNMNECFGDLTTLITGVDTFEITNFLYSNKFIVYCFETDKEGIDYFNNLKNNGVDIDIQIGPEDILVKKLSFSHKGKPLKSNKNKEKKLNEIMEYIMPKIDLTIMNPPYIRGKKEPLYLEILNHLLNENENNEIISINPANYFQDLMLYKNGSYGDILIKLTKRLNAYNEIKAVDASNLFNASFAYDLMIGSFKNNCTPVNIDNIQINKKFDCIREKILKKNKEENENNLGTIFNYGNKEPNTEHFIKITYKHGHPGKKDMVDIVASEENKDSLFVKATTKNNSRCYISFDTKTERNKNYKLFCTSKVLKFINKIFRTGAQIAYKYIPVMNFKIKQWNDEELCNFYNLTGYISDDKAKPGSDWEIILNTMKEFE